MRICFFLLFVLISSDLIAVSHPSKITGSRSLAETTRLILVRDQEAQIMEELRILDPNKAMNHDEGNPNQYMPEINDSGRVLIKLED